MRKIKDIFFKGKNITGEVGIEIEMEGENFPMEDLDSWYSRRDGSLRGQEEDKREYVLIRPCKRDGVRQRLNSLQLDLKEYGSAINPSYRTGVHIHLNVRNMTFNQVWTFIFAYLMLEDALMKFCGKEREGNLFCLRNRDAEGMMVYMEKALKSKDFRLLHTDEIRYSSMNLKAIKQYGSVEFRGLPFLGDFDNIAMWTDLLLAVKDWSLLMKSPVALVEHLSKLGGDGLAKEILGAKFFVMPALDWDRTLLDGIRRVQKLVYSVDWEEGDKSFILKTGLLEEEPKVKIPLDELLKVKPRKIRARPAVAPLQQFFNEE